MKKFTLIENGDDVGYVLNDTFYVSIHDGGMYHRSNSKKIKNAASIVAEEINRLAANDNLEVHYEGLVISASAEGNSKVVLHYKDSPSITVNYRDVIAKTVVEELVVCPLLGNNL